MTAVNSSFLRISATLKEFRIVASTAQGSPWLVDDLAGAARGLDRGARGLGEPVRVHRHRLGDLAAAQDLDRHVAAGREAGRRHGGDVDRGARVEPLFEVAEVDRLGVRPEHLERHRHLLVRPAQLAHPHVDRVLAALEARAVLGAGAGAVALVPAAGRLAVAGAVTAPHALAVLARAGGRLQVVQADDRLVGLFALLGRHDDFSSTTIRWRTAWSIPRSCGESGFSTVWPILRRPSERSVSRCLAFVPLAERTCLIRYWLMRANLCRPTTSAGRPWSRR